MNHFDAWSNEGVHDETRSRVKYTGVIFNYVLDYCLRSLNKADAFWMRNFVDGLFIVTLCLQKEPVAAYSAFNRSRLSWIAMRESDDDIFSRGGNFIAADIKFPRIS